MKINPFAAFVLCAVLLLAPVAAQAQGRLNPIKVTRDNFVFLLWDRHLVFPSKNGDETRLIQSFDINGREVKDDLSGGYNPPLWRGEGLRSNEVWGGLLPPV